MFCFSCLKQEGEESGFIVERERKTLDGVEYRYIVNNNEGMEELCKNLEDVYCAIEEFRVLKRRIYVGAPCGNCSVQALPRAD